MGDVADTAIVDARCVIEPPPGTTYTFQVLNVPVGCGTAILQNDDVSPVFAFVVSINSIDQFPAAPAVVVTV